MNLPVNLPAIDFPAPVTCVVSTSLGIFAAAGNRIYRLRVSTDIDTHHQTYEWEPMSFIADPEPQA